MFSGRMTVALVAAGAIAKKLLPDVSFATRLTEIGGESDPARFDELLAELRRRGDSAGGIVEVVARGRGARRVGEPFFDSVESVAAHLLFSIPGVKGVEFGAGFEAARRTGSANNDRIADGSGHTFTNNDGGINGGIANGNDIRLRVAFKPTPSIALPQETFDARTGTTAPLTVGGRHDACIAPAGCRRRRSGPGPRAGRPVAPPGIAAPSRNLRHTPSKRKNRKNPFAFQLKLLNLRADMDILKTYIIPWKSLSNGSHRFEFTMEAPFFAAFEETDITDGSVRAAVELKKAASMLVLDVHLEGEVTVPCDRCLADLVLPVDYDGRLTVKFSDEITDYDGDLMWINPADGELNLAQYLYTQRSTEPALPQDSRRGCRRQSPLRRPHAGTVPHRQRSRIRRYRSRKPHAGQAEGNEQLQQLKARLEAEEDNQQRNEYTY